MLVRVVLAVILMTVCVESTEAEGGINTKSCNTADLADTFELKIKPVILEPDRFQLKVEVVCKISNKTSMATCKNGIWSYYDERCLKELVQSTPRKRRKRGWGFIIGIIIYCAFGGCDRPKPRDRTKPEIRNCPTDITEEAIPIQRFAFVDWVEPTAWDNVDGNIKVVRNGKQPKSPFFGTTTIGYSAKDRSGNMATCTFTIYIKVVKCQELSTIIPDGFRVCHPSFEMVKGTTCHYGCYQGHELRGGPSQSECLPNGEWSIRTEPYCKKKECEKLLTMAPKQLTCSSEQYFRSICTFSCAPGYDIPDNTRRTKVCLSSGTWNGNDPNCIDVDPPTFNDCPNTLLFYPKDNEDGAFVHWKTPAVFDNKDKNIIPQIVSGPPNPSYLNVSTYTISYIATDLEGNVATCLFHIVVKQLRCRRLYPAPNLNIACTGTRRGSVCSFSCDENYERNGTSLTSCSKVEDKPYSKWNMTKQPFCSVKTKCPILAAPKNGALACDIWLGGELCHPFCKEGYSVLITHKFPEFYICNKDGIWMNRDKSTDCIAKEKSKRRLAEMTGEYYFTGDCFNTTVQTILKQTFINLIQLSVSWHNKCKSKCTIDNVKVTCGEKNRKRSVANMKVHMEMLFESAPNSTLASEDYESEVKSLARVVEILKGEFTSVDLSTSLNETIKLMSFSSTSLEVNCPVNSIPDFGETVGCLPCPAGTFFDSSVNSCTKCVRGSYQPDASQNECLLCPPTQSTANIGATSILDCEDACGPGTWSTTGLPPCVECDIGFYENLHGSVECTRCPGNKITVTEKSTNITECYEFDIVFPNDTNNSSAVFDDPVEYLDGPFAISLHAKCRSPVGSLVTLKSSDVNISITTEKVKINSASQNIPVKYKLQKKWYHLALQVTETDSVLFIDGVNALHLPGTGLKIITDYEVTLGGNGFVGAISQLMLTNEKDFNASSHRFSKCSSHEYDAGKINWNDFAFSQLSYSYIDVPSKCDDIDNCGPSPCLNNGSCVDLFGGYICLCKAGFTDADCNVNIDDCQSHACQNNATCQDGVDTYTCDCEHGFTGELCEITMVDGEWAEWSNWTECSVTCGNGTTQRRRSCSDPLPDNGGKYCDGKDTEIEECAFDPCRECFDLVATNHSSLTCTNTSEMIECNHTCEDGYLFDKDVKENYECGVDTFHYWDFITERNPYARLPSCSAVIEPYTVYASYTAFYDIDECDDSVRGLINERIKDIYRKLSCSASKVCIEDSNDVLSCIKRTKRDLSHERVGLTLTLSCDATSYGPKDCNDILAEAISDIQEMEEDKQLDFNHLSKTYRIISNTSSSQSRLDCPPGSIPYVLYCVPCSIGNFYFDEECHECPEGTYQHLTGQMSCKSCPDDKTTAGTASIGLEDCNVVLQTKSETKAWYIIGIVLGIPTALICVTVAIICFKRYHGKWRTIDQNNFPLKWAVKTGKPNNNLRRSKYLQQDKVVDKEQMTRQNKKQKYSISYDNRIVSLENIDMENKSQLEDFSVI